jgi:hypothetical protein
MNLNRNLLIITVALLAASIWVYQSSTGGADRFERGRRLLPNFNPDDVMEIAIAKGQDTVTLKRGDDGFTVAEADGYPAANESVNRVLRSVLEIELDKEVGAGDDLYRELGLTADADGMVEIAFNGSGGSEMVRLRVGNAFEGGNGNYLRRVDGDGGPAFLTTRRLTVSATADSFLKKEIVNVAQDEIERIDGPDFAVVRTEDGLKLDAVPRGREEKPADMNRVKNALSSLRFDEVFLADADQVRTLTLAPALDVRLTDGSGYRVALAERDGEHFLQIAGYHTVNRVTVERDETDEELEGKAEILGRADEINRFNRFHGSWVYRINDATAGKLGLRKADLTQAKG